MSDLEPTRGQNVVLSNVTAWGFGLMVATVAAKLTAWACSVPYDAPIVIGLGSIAAVVATAALMWTLQVEGPPTQGPRMLGDVARWTLRLALRAAAVYSVFLSLIIIPFVAVSMPLLHFRDHRSWDEISALLVSLAGTGGGIVGTLFLLALLGFLAIVVWPRNKLKTLNAGRHADRVMAL